MATKITTTSIEKYLDGLGKKDSKGKVLFKRLLRGSLFLCSVITYVDIFLKSAILIVRFRAYFL